MEKEKIKETEVPEKTADESISKEKEDGEVSVKTMKEVDGGAIVRPLQFGHIK